MTSAKTSAKDMRVVRLAAVPATELAALSRTALDRPFAHAAELVVAVPGDEAVILGAMQRFGELAGVELPASRVVTRRGSGGAEASVGPGTVWLQLALSRPDALVACEPERLLNRHVRPLLRALTKVGALARYFDRDWVSAASAARASSTGPVAQLGFAHDSTTGRALVEAVIAVSTPFAVRARASFLGKAPLTLHALGVAPEIDAARLSDVIIEAYTNAYGIGELSLDTASEMTCALSGSFAAAAPDDARADLPWAATREEAIGIVAAGRDGEGRVRIGGELMASRDVVARVESEIAAASAAGDAASCGERIDHAVDALAAPGVATLGVRSLRSIRDVIDEALTS